jgi:crotonobetainyl-CoA:carnitine CoA-transferase CaiB-like acyl-CoA transferase
LRDPAPPRCPPRLGEHTAEVLREWLGMRDDEIERLGKEGIFT